MRFGAFLELAAPEFLLVVTLGFGLVVVKWWLHGSPRAGASQTAVPKAAAVSQHRPVPKRGGLPRVASQAAPKQQAAPPQQGPPAPRGG